MQKSQKTKHASGEVDMVKILKHGGKKTKIIIIAVIVILAVLASFLFVNVIGSCETSSQS